MSAVLQKQAPKSASSGIKVMRKDVTKEIDPQEKEVHYVFWAGDDFLPLVEANIGLKGLDPFVVTSVDNWGSWQRDQDDKNTTGLRRHPAKNRRDEVWDTRGKEAGKNAQWLEENYAGKGLVVLRSCTGMDGNLVKEIAHSLLPEIPNTKTTGFQDIIDIIEKNRAKNPVKEVAKLQNDVADLMIQAIERANMVGLQLLEDHKSEMEQRRVSGGTGKARLDARDKRLIRLVGRTEADYSTDTRAAGEAAAQQVAKAFSAIAPAMQQNQVPQAAQGLMTMEQMQQQATVMALALQQLGFAPVQAQGAVQPIAPTANKPNNKPVQPTQ